MFTEYCRIQYIQHCFITDIKDCSAQTEACSVSFGNEQYRSTNCL